MYNFNPNHSSELTTGARVAMSVSFLAAVAGRATGAGLVAAASAIPHGDDDAGPRTIVLIGVTGDGKSSTGNTLCGRQEFTVNGGLSSVTAEVASADYLHVSPAGVNEMRVVDTIGLHDTGLPSAEVMRRFSSFADLTPSGIDVFLLTVRWGRFRPDHEAMVCAPAVLNATSNRPRRLPPRTLLNHTHPTTLAG